MKMNWGYRILMVYLLFVCGILILAYKSSQQKFDLVQTDYYGAELKYQKVIDATQKANALEGEFEVSNNGNALHVLLPKLLQTSLTKGEAQLYCIADEKRDFKKEVVCTNGTFDIALLNSMKGNYTLKLTVENKGVHYYFEKKLIL